MARFADPMMPVISPVHVGSRGGGWPMAESVGIGRHAACSVVASGMVVMNLTSPTVLQASMIALPCSISLHVGINGIVT